MLILIISLCHLSHLVNILRLTVLSQYQVEMCI